MKLAVHTTYYVPGPENITGHVFRSNQFIKVTEIFDYKNIFEHNLKIFSFFDEKIGDIVVNNNFSLLEEYGACLAHEKKYHQALYVFEKLEKYNKSYALDFKKDSSVSLIGKKSKKFGLLSFYFFGKSLLKNNQKEKAKIIFQKIVEYFSRENSHKITEFNIYCSALRKLLLISESEEEKEEIKQKLKIFEKY